MVLIVGVCWGWMMICHKHFQHLQPSDSISIYLQHFGWLWVSRFPRRSVSRKHTEEPSTSGSKTCALSDIADLRCFNRYFCSFSIQRAPCPQGTGFFFEPLHGLCRYGRTISFCGGTSHPRAPTETLGFVGFRKRTRKAKERSIMFHIERRKQSPI